MAIKNKFIHFKTRAAFDVNVPNPTSTADDGNQFYNYTTFIQDTKEIYTHGTFYKCNISEEEVEALIASKGYITEDDIPVLSGGAAATSGQYVSGVTVSGHTVTVTKAALPSAATIAPKASGTAAVGTSTKYAREDHVHPLQTNVATATKLATPRVIAIAGAVSGSATFDGSGNVSINSTLNNFDASKITSGTISIDRLPKGALERLVIVANQTARFALTTNDVQEGDTVKQTDTGIMYFVVDSTKLDSEAGYSIYTAGAATSVPWSGVTDKPSSFTPSAHTHAANEITSGTLDIARIPSLGSNKITSLSSYVKAPKASAISVNDSLNTALGKLERALDAKANSTSLNSYLPLSGGTITGNVTFTNFARINIGNEGSYIVHNDLGGGSIIFFGDSRTIIGSSDTETLKSLLLRSISDPTLRINNTDYTIYSSHNLTKVSQLTNDANYITTSSLSNYVAKSGDTMSGNLTLPSITLNGKVINDVVAENVDSTLTWTEAIKDGKRIPSLTLLAYWNGYYKQGSSNLRYCASGEIASKSWVEGKGYLTSIPVATSSAYGGIQIGYATSGKNYAVQLSNGKAYVNVPWTDTNTTYTSGTNISISGTTINCTYSYSLPKATSLVLGGVKIGSNITVSSGTISLSKSNVTSALGYTPSSPLIQTGTITNNTITAGYAYDVSSAVVNMVSGFSESNPDAVVATASKITSFPSECSVMDGIMDLNGSVYVYCFTYIGGTVYINGAVYA